jgi:hypothetical protein
MKSENPSPRKIGAARGKSNAGMPHLPMEWMDPMSWRLAPLIMRAPKAKKRPEAPDMAMDPDVGDLPANRGQVKEAPARTASFR